MAINGEFLELYHKLKADINDVDKSFASLKTLTTERWRQHNESSIEFRKDLHKQVDKIDGKAEDINAAVNQLHGSILQRPCKEHENEMKWIKGSMYVVYLFVIGLIGTVVTMWLQGK